MLRIVASTPDQLHEIPIHDAWFDVDRLVHDKAERTLLVPFAQDPYQTPDALQPHPDELPDALQPQLVRKQGRAAEYRAPMVGWLMTVSYVREIQAKDGWANMGKLTGLSFDPAKNRLTIRSNGKLRAVVDALRVQAVGGTTSSAGAGAAWAASEASRTQRSTRSDASTEAGVERTR